MALSNLVVRSLSGIIIAVMIVSAVVFSKWTLLALSVVITIGSIIELFKLSNTFPIKIFSVLISGLFVVIFFLSQCYSYIHPVYISLFFIPMVFVPVLELYRKKENPIENIAVSYLGFFYIAVPMCVLNLIGTFNAGYNEYNYLYPLGFIFLVWMNDVGAYMIGSTIGKNRFFPRISPNKSWEGFWGGFIFTVSAGGVIGYLTDTNIHMWLLVAVVTSLGGVAGDLVESMFKRVAGVKDSGNIIPGHGGFLDRFDAMFISLPLVFIIFRFF